MTAYDMTPEDENLRRLSAAERKRARLIETVCHDDQSFVYRAKPAAFADVDVMGEALKILGDYRISQYRQYPGNQQGA